LKQKKQKKLPLSSSN